MHGCTQLEFICTKHIFIYAAKITFEMHIFFKRRPFLRRGCQNVFNMPSIHVLDKIKTLAIATQALLNNTIPVCCCNSSIWFHIKATQLCTTLMSPNSQWDLKLFMVEQQN